MLFVALVLCIMCCSVLLLFSSVVVIVVVLCCGVVLLWCVVVVLFSGVGCLPVSNSNSSSSLRCLINSLLYDFL